jgi:serine/threonine-protein kinase
MQVGQMIAGKYRIDRVLGRGGMGAVAAATNVVIDQRVALKFLLPELMGEPTVIERFLREARAAAKLRSEHVCLVYDVGHHDGVPFIVMELLDGCDLASMVNTRVMLSCNVATDYLLQVTEGLAEAHALGIVHRDLKPANLFLTQRVDGSPLIKVLDFGIAKAPTDAQFNLTRTAAVMGSPGYMSPEQLRSSRDADARSDIWALGVILFELTAGRPPFIAESITELTLKVAMDPLPALPNVPREFERVVARCLEKDPNRRFPDVAELAAALAPFSTGRGADIAATVAQMLYGASGRGAMAKRAGTEAGAERREAAPRPTTLGASASAIANVPVRRARRWWSVAVGLLVIGGVVGGALATRPNTEREAVVPSVQIPTKAPTPAPIVPEMVAMPPPPDAPPPVIVPAPPSPVVPPPAAAAVAPPPAAKKSLPPTTKLAPRPTAKAPTKDIGESRE